MMWWQGVEIEMVEKLWPKPFIGRIFRKTIYLLEGTPVTRQLIAHELRHIFDRRRWQYLWLLAYGGAWVIAGFSYKRNWFERKAREAESDPVFLMLADGVIQRWEP